MEEDEALYAADFERMRKSIELGSFIIKEAEAREMDSHDVVAAILILLSEICKEDKEPEEKKKWLLKTLDSLINTKIERKKRNKDEIF